MFIRKRPTQVARATVTSLVAHGTCITGDVSFEGCLFLEGQVDGQVLATAPGALLTIGEQGLVQGDVHVPAAIVHGKVRGDVHAVETLELTATSRVAGDVFYRSIIVAAGAQIQGRLQHDASNKDVAAALLAAPSDTRAVAGSSEPALEVSTAHSLEAVEAGAANASPGHASDSSVHDVQSAGARKPPPVVRPGKRGRPRAAEDNA